MDPYVAKVIKLLDQNKALAGFLVPFVGALLVTLANYIVTGTFNADELRIALGGTLVSIASGLTVYKVPTRQALVDAVPPPVGEGH